jgi:hypothetical protein
LFLEEAERPKLPSSDFMAITELSSILANNIDRLSEGDLSSIFSVVEQAIVIGTKDARETATTGFLEGLQNLASAGCFLLVKVVPFLGPESRAYCRAWDEFTGVPTPGLEDS